jgi:hypothetical protein
MSKKKYFHISDILSVSFGRAVSDQKRMEDPDGNIRGPFKYAVCGIEELIEHITPVVLSRKGGRYGNRAELSHGLSIANPIINEKFSWLKDIDFPNLPDDSEEREKQLQDWIDDVAKKNGGYWHKIKPYTGSQSFRVG